jgi:hypothetical protein
MSSRISGDAPKTNRQEFSVLLKGKGGFIQPATRRQAISDSQADFLTYGFRLS